VLHVYDAIVEGKPVIDRVIAMTGSGFVKNAGFRVRIGTSVDELVNSQIKKELELRIIIGNILNEPERKNLSFPVTKHFDQITALEDFSQSRFLGYLHPGWDQNSYTNAFLSKLVPFFKKKVNTSLNGEERPCVACGFCEEVCPAHLLPIHLSRACESKDSKLADELGLNACIECGLCSFVCPSKIPMLSHFQKAKQ